MELEQVGAIIKKYREDRNMSLDTVRKRSQVEIGQSTLADLEAGKHPPSSKTRAALAAAHGWPNDWYDRMLSDDTAFLTEPSGAPSTVDLDGVAIQLTDLASTVARIDATVAEMSARLLAMSELLLLPDADEEQNPGETRTGQ